MLGLLLLTTDGTETPLAWARGVFVLALYEHTKLQEEIQKIVDKKENIWYFPSRWSRRKNKRSVRNIWNRRCASCGNEQAYCSLSAAWFLRCCCGWSQPSLCVLPFAVCRFPARQRTRRRGRWRCPRSNCSLGIASR